MATTNATSATSASYFVTKGLTVNVHGTDLFRDNDGIGTEKTVEITDRAGTHRFATFKFKLEQNSEERRSVSIILTDNTPVPFGRGEVLVVKDQDEKIIYLWESLGHSVASQMQNLSKSYSSFTADTVTLRLNDQGEFECDIDAKVSGLISTSAKLLWGSLPELPYKVSTKPLTDNETKFHDDYEAFLNSRQAEDKADVGESDEDSTVIDSDNMSAGGNQSEQVDVNEPAAFTATKRSDNTGGSDNDSGYHPTTNGKKDTEDALLENNREGKNADSAQGSENFGVRPESQDAEGNSAADGPITGDNEPGPAGESSSEQIIGTDSPARSTSSEKQETATKLAGIMTESPPQREGSGEEEDVNLESATRSDGVDAKPTTPARYTSPQPQQVSYAAAVRSPAQGETGLAEASGANENQGDSDSDESSEEDE